MGRVEGGASPLCARLLRCPSPGLGPFYRDGSCSGGSFSLTAAWTRDPVEWVVCGGRVVKSGAQSLGQRAVPGRGTPVKATSHLVCHVVCLPHG